MNSTQATCLALAALSLFCPPFAGAAETGSWGDQGDVERKEELNNNASGHDMKRQT